MSDPTVILYDGATDYDISAQVQSVSLKRGRTRELDTIEPATGTINLINYDRSFDPPQYNGDTSFGAIVPGMRVEIFDGAVQVFAGYVLDWDHRWRNTKESTASIYITDALGTLAGTTFTAHQATDLQDAGARITEGLDRAEVGFPSGVAYRDINPGIDPLQGDIVPAGTNVLNRFQLIARSDLGRLYVTRDGVLTYRSRHDVLGTTPDSTFTDGTLPSGDLFAALLALNPEVLRVFRYAGGTQDTTNYGSLGSSANLVELPAGNADLSAPDGYTYRRLSGGLFTVREDLTTISVQAGSGVVTAIALVYDTSHNFYNYVMGTADALPNDFNQLYATPAATLATRLNASGSLYKTRSKARTRTVGDYLLVEMVSGSTSSTIGDLYIDCVDSTVGGTDGSGGSTGTWDTVLEEYQTMRAASGTPNSSTLMICILPGAISAGQRSAIYSAAVSEGWIA